MGLKCLFLWVFTSCFRPFFHSITFSFRKLHHKKYVTNLNSWFDPTTTSINTIFWVHYEIGQFSTIYPRFRPFFHSIEFPFRSNFVPLWSKMIPWNFHGASCSGGRARTKRGWSVSFCQFLSVFVSFCELPSPRTYQKYTLAPQAFGLLCWEDNLYKLY